MTNRSSNYNLDRDFTLNSASSEHQAAINPRAQFLKAEVEKFLQDKKLLAKLEERNLAGAYLLR